MRSKVRIIVAAVSILAFFSLIALGGSGVPAAHAQQAIKLSAGAMGQSPYMLLALVAKYLEDSVPGLKATVIAGGAVANLKLVDQKKVDVGFTTHSIYLNALKGQKPFEKEFKDLRVLANIQGHGAFYFMVTENTGLESIEEIKQEKYPLKICTFLKAGPPEVYTRRVLAEYGMTYEDIESWGGTVNFSQWTDCVSLVRDGHANALLGATSLPSAFHAEAAKARDMRMLPLKEEVIKSMMEKYGDLRIIIPKSTYGITPYDMPTVGNTYYLFAHKDLSDQVAYELVRQLAEHAAEVRDVHTAFKRFEADKMPTDIIGEIHPGAMKFFKEKGWK